MYLKYEDGNDDFSMREANYVIINMIL